MSWLRTCTSSTMFQYPQADRRGCNVRMERNEHSSLISFQYPQADRRGCNDLVGVFFDKAVLFQYPQADRRGCNSPPSTDPPTTCGVSVSTSGSKGVQHPVADTGTHQVVRFSIHKRIEGGATGVTFLTPPTPVMFQYPQADRRGCNESHSFNLHAPDGCFSIHKRIEGGATTGSNSPSSIVKWFQYPQADRRGCNEVNSYHHRYKLEFQYPQADRRGCN